MNKIINRFWIGSPPWIIIGFFIIIVPIYIFWTLDTIKRQKEGTTNLLLEKAAALIRSFEAGTRTGMMGMMGMHRDRFQLQRLLMETAQQPDIVYIIVTDIDGTIRAHSDPEKIGNTYGKELNTAAIPRSKELRWRIVSDKNGTETFEVYRRFLPTRNDFPIHHRGMIPDFSNQGIMPPEYGGPERAQIIFVGFDMRPFEEARKEDTRHVMIMASILLLIGFGGIFSLFLVQAYRSTRSSLTRIKVFSDSVVEHMPIGLIALDADRRVASINQAATSLLKVQLDHQLDHMIGKSIDNMLPQQVKVILDEVELSKETIEKEADCIFPDGRIVPIDFSVSPLEGDDSIFLGYIILCRDLTEIQFLKREVERSQRLAYIGRLAAGIAHEIRNPLSSIKGFATYFRERYRDVYEDKKTAEIMIQEVERLNRVISQLLEFSRPVNIQKKPINIHTLVQHSLKMIEKDAHEKRIKIDSSVPPDLRTVSLDADRFNQVLLNLYLNSIESMNEGGVLTVDINEDKESQKLRIVISDTGHGIRKDNLINIFDPYFTTKPSGTGLGLAIVHRIIESHTAEIRVESEESKGTKVIISIPYE